MDRTNAATSLKKLIRPLIASQGLELWGLEVVNNPRPTARIFIEAQTNAQSATQEDLCEPKPAQSVSIEQCAKISRLIGLTLEAEAPFAAQWTLEISSPGLERHFFSLPQLEPYLSQDIQVALKEEHPSWPNRKNFLGSLIEVKVPNNTFTISLSLKHRTLSEPETVQFSWDQVHKSKLIHNFPEPSKKPRPSKRLRGDIHEPRT